MKKHSEHSSRIKPTTSEIAVFAMLGSVMYASKIIMELAPNIHLVGVFTIAFTIVYLWTVLWGAVMLLPINLPKKIRPIVYMAVCAAHGFLYGTLYAPAQAILYGFSLKQTIAWIIAGLPFDCIHGISNFFCGILIVPIISALRIAQRSAPIS